MTAAGVAEPVRPRSGASLLWGFLALSVLAHGGLLAWAGDVRPQVFQPKRPTELVMVEVQKPPPEPPKPATPPKVRPKPPPPVRMTVREKPPEPETPPPPNETEVPEEKVPPPLVVGVSLSSTTSAGTFAAAVGNTLYGKSAPVAKNPSDVKGYSLPRYVPSYQVDSSPQPIEEIRADYPPEVRRDEIEGSVLLSVVVDFNGQVGEVKVLKSLDPRLDALAVRTLKASRWRPAIQKGQPVSTEIKYNFRFELDR